MRKYLLSILLAGAFTLAASAAWAAAGTYFVSGTGGVTTGNDTNNCTDWSTPCLSVSGAIAKATTAATNPNTIAVDKTGNFTSNSFYQWNGAAGVQYYIVSSTNGTSGTTIVPSVGATENNGSGTNGFLINGGAGTAYRVYGMTLIGSTSNGSSSYIWILGTTTDNFIFFDTCTLSLPTTGAQPIIFGNSSSNSIAGIKITALNTTFSFGSKSSGALAVYGAQVELIHPTFTFGATKPSALINGVAGASGIGSILIRDGDLSPYTGTALVAVNTIDALQVIFQNDLFSGTPTHTSGTWNQGIGSITFRNSDSSNTLYTLEYRNAFGTLTAETTDYVTSGGFQFNGAPAAWKVVTSSLANQYTPFVLPSLVKWGTTTTAETATTQIVQVNGATLLTDQDIWSDLEYPTSGAPPAYAWKSNQNASPIVGTPANQPNATVAWTGSNVGASPVTQQLSNTFTASAAGLLQSVIRVGKASLTFWLNPAIDGAT